MAPADCEDALREGSWGVLAVTGDEGWPYAVPVNYVYAGGCIWIHGAKAGHKMDAVRRDSRVSFCVTAMAQNRPEEFTTYYRSVIAFCRAAIVEDPEEKRRAIIQLADRFSPDEPPERRDREIDREWNALSIIRLDIEHMTGKMAIELLPSADSSPD